MRIGERLPEPLRYAWDALFHDGGEYGMFGAMSGGVLWAVILVATVVILAHILG